MGEWTLVFLALGWLALPLVALWLAARAQRESTLLRERLERLERLIAARPAGDEAPWLPPPRPPGPMPVGAPDRPVTAETAAAPASAAPGAASAAAPGAAPAAAPGVGAPAIATPAAPSPGVPVPAAPPPAAVAAARRRTFDSARLEDLVGSVWLQNAGAVLILAGAFFMIVWGWTTGRFGPGVLVVAGVVAGLLLAARGHVVRGTLPGLGHAFVGTGCGVVWLSLYLGHFTLRVLPAGPAFALLVATSALTFAAGLRYGVQSLAGLGVIGAFLPQALATLLPLAGYSLAPGPMLAYLAVVNALVFALAARAGWSALALAALALSSVTWLLRFPEVAWGWGVEIGLAATFGALGLAPLPGLARVEGRVRLVDLAVVAVAPLAFLACSAPWIRYVRPTDAALVLFALAALYAGAAAWVDARRPERDLWRPLTGAAALYLAAALQRAVGPEAAPLAWTLEGALLVSLGVSPRGGWLRLCGYAIGLAGIAGLLDSLLAGASWRGGLTPVLHPAAVRDGLAIAALLLAADRLARGRDLLHRAERWTPEAGTAIANLALMLWLGREANHAARAVFGHGPAGAPPARGPWSVARQGAFTGALLAAAWLAQASALAARGLRDPRPFLRLAAHVVGLFGVVTLLVALTSRDGWGRDQLVALHPAGAVTALGVLLAAAVAAALARARGDHRGWERRAAEVWAAAAMVASLAWLAREVDHFARVVVDAPGAWEATRSRGADLWRAELKRLAPVLVSATWLAQGLAVFVAGWLRRAAFLRWAGLATLALTVGKLLLVDLATADPFWRFLSAIVAGVALLAVSTAYQRRRRRERTP